MATSEDDKKKLMVSVDPPSEKSFIHMLVGGATLTLFVGWIHFLNIVLIWSLWSNTARVIGVILIASLWAPATFHWKQFTDSFVLKCWRYYFNFTYFCEDLAEFSADRRLMFCHFPHGVFPMAPILAGSVADKIIPGLKVNSVSASNVFRIPGYYHFFRWIGASPATKENMVKFATNGSCAVVVGGLAEMYMQEADKERIMVKERQGFVKVAVETGCDLVPVYYYGNTKVLNFGPQSLREFSRRTKMSWGVVYGMFYLPIPYPHPIHMVLGKPIKVKQVSPSDPDFQTTVDETHERFKQSLQELYDRHKGLVGWDHIPLVME